MAQIENKKFGILTGEEIEKEYAAGNIIIHPKTRSAGPNSYDVSLGAHFWRESAGMFDRPAGNKIYLIDDENSIKSNWNYCRAVTWEDAISELNKSGELTDDEINYYITKMDLNQLVILLYPGEKILGHTEEFIGSVGTAPITTEMKARSSAGRSLISVCLCAGMGDPGYCTRWTMEIANGGKKIVPLKVGMRLAQIVFVTTVGNVEDYASKGHYFEMKESDDNNDSNIILPTSIAKRQEFIKSMVLNWHPDMMLPSADALKL